MRNVTSFITKVYPFFIIFILMSGISYLQADNHIIKFGGTLGTVYSPSTLSVTVGDTVTWEGSFNSHPLSSTSVPDGAAEFSNGSGTSFSYTVMTPGEYDYQCDVHAGLGMTGSFSAVVSGFESYPASGIPGGFQLDQNFPNPFNPVTHIGYVLPADSYVRLSIYNLIGQEVAALVDGEQEAGYHQVTWNASSFSSGPYISRLTARERDGREVLMHKGMILMK